MSYVPRDVTDAQIDAIPGWLQGYDVDLFRLLLDHTAQSGGDLAELGTYLGKSAVLIGSSLRPGEHFTVVDLFGGDAVDDANQAENDDQYDGLTRGAFEQNYRAVHGDLPEVVTGLSESVVDHARHGRHRFVHVDAGHLYDNVVGDIEAARTLLKPGGVVVFDDFRSEHTPGVAAAVWRATAGGLCPFAVTPVKLYATFGDSGELVSAVKEWVAKTRWHHETQSIAGHDVVRVWWEPEPLSPTGHESLARRAARTLRRLRG